MPLKQTFTHPNLSALPGDAFDLEARVMAWMSGGLCLCLWAGSAFPPRIPLLTCVEVWEPHLQHTQNPGGGHPCVHGPCVLCEEHVITGTSWMTCVLKLCCLVSEALVLPRVTISKQTIFTELRLGIENHHPACLGTADVIK